MSRAGCDVVKFEFYVALQITFGNSKTSPCTSKKSFAFLVQFLSDIVPYETGRYLKVFNFSEEGPDTP